MLAVVATAGVSSRAQAQVATALDRYEPAPAGDTLTGVQMPSVDGEFKLAGRLVLSYAHAPLLLVDNRTVREVGTVVSHQLTLHSMLSMSLFGRAKVAVDVPLTLSQGGDGPALEGLATTSPDGAAVNDLRAGLRLELLKQDGASPSAAISFTAWLPTGDEQAYAGTGATRFEPAIIVGADYGPVVWSAYGGRRFDDSAGDGLLGHELAFGVGGGPRLGPVLISVELMGTTVAQRGTSAFARETTSVEAHLGGMVDLGSVSFRLGGGPGLTPGLGTPDYRLLAGVGIADDFADDETQSSRSNAQREANTGQSNARFPTGAILRDLDGDGVEDDQDICPDVVGVASGTKPGCPADRDGDGAWDQSDACPDQAGSRNSDPARDGCPVDTDGDGIVDGADACPTETGEAASDPKTTGCPKSVRVVGEQIVILQTVAFATGKAELLDSADGLLDEVAQVMIDRPEIVRLAIEGHTDNVGREALNLALSQRRAVAVMRWLIAHGVDERRLEARGYGPRRPIGENDTPEGRAKNRRVDFQILKRDPRGEQAWTDGPAE